MLDMQAEAFEGIPKPEERIVPSQLPTKPFCGLAFVGESPGINEVEHLIPFCGQSGRVFDAVLRSAGIDREACWVGNVFSTKLEDNDMKREKAKQGVGWGGFWESNTKRLASELAECQPILTVALGGTALLALAGTSAISQYRGQPMMGKGAFASIKLFPTWHPSFLLRVWKNYTVWLGDMLRAKAELEAGPGMHWPARSLNIAPSIEEVEHAAIVYQQGSGPLSCDIETGWGQIRGVAFAPSQSEALYVPFTSLATLSRSYWPTAQLEKRAWQAVRTLLECERPKLGQNFANYDVIWLLTQLGIRPRNYCHDLRLLHKTLYPELPAGLAFMGSAHSAQGAWKSWARHGGLSTEGRGEKRDD